MAAQKKPSPTARVRRSRMADAVAGTATPTDADDTGPVKASDRDLVYVIVKRDGKEVTEAKSVARSVLAAIRSGMETAFKLETTWRDNATAIIDEFFAAPPTGTKAEIVKALRESTEIDIMYQVFQQRHPSYAATMELLEKSKVGGKDGDVFKSAYNNDIGKIRTTANSQAVRVCGFYADAHATDKTDAQRVQETARSLIEAARKEWANRILTGRGKFGETLEKELLQSAIDALQQCLTDDTLARAARLAEANKLSLKKPGELSDDVAGEVEDYEEATAT